MKKICFFLILLFLNFNYSTAQQLTETEKLATLGKLYGYLKYYHPEVASGKFNWDDLCINQIPLVLKATTKSELSAVYNKWIDSLGIIEKCKNCKSEVNSFDKNFDLSWTQDSRYFEETLTKKLKYIEENRLLGDHFYLEKQPVGNIKVINEPVYENSEYPNEHYRLLGLFKYWNIIEYFFPYKYLTDQKWDSVLTEMIPNFRNTSNQTDYQLVMKELVAKLDDSHAYINLKNEHYNSLPIKLANIENKAVVCGFYNDSLARINGFKLGDVILKINGLDVVQETEQNLKYVSASNADGKQVRAYYKILSGKETTVNLIIERNNVLKELQANRYAFKDFNYGNQHAKSVILDESIGYIDMANFKRQEINETFKAFSNKKAIIIDLRNYPDFIYNLVARQINSKRKDFVRIYSPNINYPGKFSYKKNLETGTKNKDNYKGKVILLVNGETISRSEFTVMALQTADNVVTIGSQTAGADGDVAYFEFIGGYPTSISGNGILYPDGSETQRKGVKIDVEFHPTIEGLRQDRDEVLEKAVEIAKQH
ncbi:C-terminal processing protease CtpA/Prc [Flavobacterium arsenatis]|uniref:C-terminal processing protease CtpA/Prc n=1 Tax=Flavobacterium arsenatis TaxID=1484332 RepID=A0ABU1TMI4_9FLAO|nr:S41 family peptidase [Flavobacterium arsenatis]MDR6967172.1 C-terminal processing protease CtpA/Prc [Flavobacterium arsenatis]